MWRRDVAQEDSGKLTAVVCEVIVTSGFGLGVRKKVWIPDMPHSKKQMLLVPRKPNSN